ncbi:bifunctional cobalt-precorrin-7 (C(5))-methyltransferase/cobalt-precorrin-6B (C(15))-methyltransferase [Nocardia flavorosea]|uniref:Bifunctional cobalt-precorrin-7 (C(5))-methyltransferase/cobalt-precorrin-6B (C(15))-methyltransferase n=1 Tax=Nocardia flavorosea TaxID=53429 RepID=A0A846YM71_9NOCA|nr:bifunctional cobalt-precorrin-7 (C(5))-methyltransferase/cobalt-precorrin-6B (C(15))-methyltransferase [Nocardia flavorosea]NKY58029.1 bifunctional cobalt-precorrin-7 (C(5))-methyltransferase/cobalt-precorrin-6B (C(15))-methyltransferase [Nocardia flavorosea]
MSADSAMWSAGPRIPVVGIGADGWAGLSETSRQALRECTVLLGSDRQLGLLPPEIAADRQPWPSPLVPALPGLLADLRGARLGILASGDPMFYGIGTTLARLLGPESLRVLPQPSSASLACARLGWPLPEVGIVSAVGRPVRRVLPELIDGRRVLVLSADADTPAEIVELLRSYGFGPSRVTLLEQLGGPAERIVSGLAADWREVPGDPLNIVAIAVAGEPGHPRRTRQPGLPDSAYTGDGQLTKSEIRALTLAALAPGPGEILWDIGGGSGSIAIEWCRTHPSCRAVTFEILDRRREQIAGNARALGVPDIEMRGEAVAELAGEAVPGAPDAIFLGGGLTTPQLFDLCWSRLPAGGRLVANAVTAESETLLISWAGEHGGDLRRFQIYRGEPLGRFTTWRPQLPVTQWSVVKGRSPAATA